MKTLELLFISLKPWRFWRILIIFTPLLLYPSMLTPFFLLKLSTAFVLFCLLTGAISIIDDLNDKEKDRTDPLKRIRPIASGEMSASKAEFALVSFITASFVAAFFLGPIVGIIAVMYFLAELVYFFFLKNYAALDAICMSVEISLLLFAGIVSGGKEISPWIFVFIITFSMFFFYCDKYRTVLLSRQMPSEEKDITPFAVFINVFACFSLMTYTFYSIISPIENNYYVYWSIPFLVYSVCKTILLMSKKSSTESLETLLLKDKATWVNVLLWSIFLAVSGLLK